MKDLPPLIYIECAEATTVPATGLGPSSTHTKKRLASGDLRQKAETLEEEEQTGPSKRQKLNGKKRDIMEVEEAEQADSSKRQKSEGQDGCKQLGCSTHKGIS